MCESEFVGLAFTFPWKPWKGISARGITNCAYWFGGLYNLVEVSGFENLAGITTATQMFAGCMALESIYATSFASAISSASMMFYNCPRLVGVNGTAYASSRMGFTYM